MKEANSQFFSDITAGIDYNDPALLSSIKQRDLPVNFYQELQMAYSLVQTHTDTSVRADRIEQHSHGFFELLYCVQGNVDYLLGTKRHHIRPGDIIFAPPGVIHCPIFPEEMDIPYQRNVIWISPGFVTNLQTIFPETFFHKVEPKVLHTAGTKWEYLELFFNRGVQEATAKAPGWEVCVYGNTIQLIAHLHRALYEDSASHSDYASSDLLEDVLNYIQQHLHEKLTLASTAKEFAVCESTISQLFRKQMGTSFYRCVTQRRLTEAKTLIAQGLSLEQVSTQTGFTDYSSFYRAFKSEFGISPREFKKLDDLRSGAAK